MSKCGPDGKITLASVYMTIFAPGSHPNVHSRSKIVKCGLNYDIFRLASMSNSWTCLFLSRDSNLRGTNVRLSVHQSVNNM